MQGVPQGWFSRSRSLADYDAKFGAGLIVATIRQCIAVTSSQDSSRVLEIGCGEGRVVMQLRKLFPRIELHGINLEPWPAMQGSHSLPATALRYGIFDSSELEGVLLPSIHFYDAQQLAFASDYFDVIISQVTIPYVARKDRLLEEVWRTLKPGGTAFLHLDSTRGGDPALLGGDCPCFVLHANGRRIPVADLFKALRTHGFDLLYHAQVFHDEGEGRLRYLLVMRKNTADALRLGTSFDAQASYDLRRLHRRQQDWKHLWGYRSVFQAPWLPPLAL